MSSYDMWTSALLAQEGFECDGALSDLNVCLDMYRHLYNEGQQAYGDHPHELMIRFLNMLYLQISYSGREEFLNEALSVAEAACTACSSSCADYPAVLAMLAAGLRIRFVFTSTQSDLDESLEHARAALEVCSATSPYRAMCLYELGRSLTSICRSLRDLDCYEQAIAAYRDILSIEGVSPYTRINAIAALGWVLWARYINFGGSECLEEAWTQTMEAMNLRPSSHISSTDTLHTASVIMYSRYVNTGSLTNIERSAAFARQSLAMRPKSTAALGDLSNALGTRGYALANRADLDEAIELQREVMTIISAHHWGRDAILHNHGGNLGARYSLWGEFADLDESLSVLRQALVLRPQGHPRRSATLDSLANTLQERYIGIGQSDDLDEAIAYNRDALSLRSEGDPRYVHSLRSLGMALVQRNSTLSDLDEAIVVFRQAVTMANEQFATSSKIGIAEALLKQHYTTADIVKLRTALDYAREALHSEDLSNRRPAQSSLAEVHYALFLMLGPQAGLADIYESHRIYSDVSETGSPYRRYESNIHLAEIHADPRTPLYDLGAAASYVHSNLTSNHRSARLSLLDVLKFIEKIELSDCNIEERTNTPEFLSVYKAAVQLLPRATYFSLDIRDRLLALRHTEALSLRGSSCALYMSLDDIALEILEQGRGIFWAQALRLRTPLDDVPKNLQKELREIARRMESRSYVFGRRLYWKEEAEQEQMRNREDVERFDELLSEVRALPGLETFLLHEPAERLAAAGGSGPIVILVAGRFRCHAIAVSHDRKIKALQLRDVDSQWVDSTSKELNRLVDSSRSREPKRLGIKHGRNVPKHIVRERKILQDLWRKVVSPVIDLLGLKPQSARNRPRLWWIPTGKFNFLPLHAAGTDTA